MEGVWCAGVLVLLRDVVLVLVIDVVKEDPHLVRLMERGGGEHLYVRNEDILNRGKNIKKNG